MQKIVFNLTTLVYEYHIIKLQYLNWSLKLKENEKKKNNRKS